MTDDTSGARNSSRGDRLGPGRPQATAPPPDRAEPLFIEEGDRFLPTDASGGYWAPNTLSGRDVAGLLGFVLEQAYGDPVFVPVRFGVDLLQPAPRVPLKVNTRLVRDGGRLKLADAELWADGALVARAHAQFLRRSPEAAATTWQSPGWSAPPPHDLAPDEQFRHVWDLRHVEPPPGARHAWRRGEALGASEATPATPGSFLGRLAPIQARQAWVRETRDLIAGRPTSPFARVALAADFTSALANGHSDGIDFINTDMTVYLQRLPTTEWLGMELVRHNAAAGLAIGETWLHDEAGPIGSVTVAALAQSRRGPGPDVASAETHDQPHDPRSSDDPRHGA